MAVIPSAATIQRGMTKQQIQEFWAENGYYHARGVFSPSEIAELEGDFDRIVSQLRSSGEEVNARWGGAGMDALDAGESVIFHTHNVQCFSHRWLTALQKPQFLDIVEAMIGPDIVLHHSKLFQKPAENGSPFPMHQDYTYFPTERDTMMAGVIHVTNATDEMGCLRIYPGSHKLGRFQQGYYLDEEQSRQWPIEEATLVEAEAGDVVFFHYLTLHGSMPNRSNSVRKTVLSQMHAGHDRVEPSGEGHPNARLVLRGWNWAATRSLAESAR